MQALELLAVLLVSLSTFLTTRGAPPELDAFLGLLTFPFALAGGAACAWVAGRKELLHGVVLAALALFARFMVHGEGLPWAAYLDIPFLALGAAAWPFVRKGQAQRF